jgi:signal transduction histidine kinase
VAGELRQELLARIEGTLRPETAAELRLHAQQWRRIRENQYVNTRNGGTPLRVALHPPRTDRANPVGRVWVQRLASVEIDGDEEQVWLGGEIPSFVERVSPEAGALTEDEDVAAIALFSPWGRVLFASDTHTWHEPGGPEDDFRHAVRLQLAAGDDALDGWRVEAVAAPPSGIPGSAALLAAAVLITTLALAWGAFALRRAAAEYAQLAEARRTFLDHVAHEIRTPASALLALSEELRSGHVTTARQREYHDHLMAESRRLARLVEDTLDLTRLEAGRLAMRREPADLCALVREAIDSEVALQLPDIPLTVEADAGALRRCVRNLVENAVRHGAGGRAPEVRLTASDGVAKLSVRDHGPGIAPEHRERVFERFYRVPSPTHEVKGVGLGLALCRTVARAHGGDIVLQSPPGGGATFVLSIPLSGDAA